MIGLGGNSTLGIGMSITLRNNFSSTAKQVTDDMQRMHGMSKNLMRDNLRDVGKMGMGLVAVGGAVTLGFRSAINAASEFQLTMTKVKALGELDNPQTKYLGNLAKSLAQKYGIMPNEIAGGILELVKRGIGNNDIPKVLESQLMTAIGADERLGGKGGVAARMMDMAMAWGYQAKDMNRIGDVMARGAQLTSMDFLDLAESMRYSQDVMKNLNLTFEEGVSMIGLLSNAGIKGTSAGTALSNLYTQFTIALTGASKKKNAALATLGLDPQDFIKANGDIENLIPMLKKLDVALKPFGGVAKQGLLNDIFGIRGKRAVGPLVDALTGDNKLGLGIEKLLSEVRNSEGTNQKIYNQIADTFEMRKKRFGATWETFKINVGTALLPALTGILKALTPMLTMVASFAESRVGKVLIAAIASGGIMALLFGGFLLLVSKIGLAFLGWKSTLDQIKFSMGWVMGGMGSRGFSGGPGGAGPGGASSGGFPGGVPPWAFGMSPYGYATKMTKPGWLSRIGKGRASVAGLSRLAGQRGGILGKLFSTLIRFVGPIINLFASLAKVLGPVLSLFGRLIPIVGWIFTAWSIFSALNGKDDETSYQNNPPPDKYNYQMAQQNKYGDPYYVPATPNNQQSNRPINVNVKPSNVNLHVDGEKKWSEKVQWEAEQSAADEGFNQ